jgi:serine protease
MIGSTGSVPRRGRLGLIALAAVALGVALVAGTGLASAQTTSSSRSSHYGYTSFVGGQRANAVEQAAGDLTYHGGFIQDHVRVYLVFWGSQWTGDRNGVRAYLTNYFKGLGTSSDHWSTVTSQYTGRGGHPVFGTSVLKGVWVDTSAKAPSRASAGQIASEAHKAVTHFNAARFGHNLSIIVVSPHGTHPDGFNTPGHPWCAWHDADRGVPFTNMPYVLDLGSSCGANSVRSRLDGFSIVSGHEYLEAVTDPVPPSGWVDSQGAENADKCAWRNLHTISLPSGTFAVQPTWSNRIHGCAG